MILQEFTLSFLSSGSHRQSPPRAGFPGLVGNAKEWGIGSNRERERRKVMDKIIQVRVCGIQLEDDDSQWGSYTESKNA